MSVIWKYPVPLAGTVLNIPKGAWFLSAQAQEQTTSGPGYHSFAIQTWWFVPDPTAETDEHVIRAFGTGQPFEEKIDTLVPLGTVQLDGYVWHVFEQIVDG